MKYFLSYVFINESQAPAKPSMGTYTDYPTATAIKRPQNNQLSTTLA